MASASVFCVKASFGHRATSAARATFSHAAPTRPTTKALAIDLRVRSGWLLIPVILVIPVPILISKRIEKVDDGLDLLICQDQISSERRHNSLRIALGLVEDDRDEFLAIWITFFHVSKFGADIARRVATFD